MAEVAGGSPYGGPKDGRYYTDNNNATVDDN